MLRHIRIPGLVLLITVPCIALQGGAYNIGALDINGGGTTLSGGVYELTASTAQAGGIDSAGGIVNGVVYNATDGYWYVAMQVARPAGDFNNDDDVDGFDFLTFSVCFNGSLLPPQSGCPTPDVDIDGDSDVDGFDFLTFSTCFNGSNKPPNC